MTLIHDPKWKLDNSEWAEQFEEPYTEYYCRSCLEGWNTAEDDFEGEDREQCPYCASLEVVEL